MKPWMLPAVGCSVLLLAVAASWSAHRSAAARLDSQESLSGDVYEDLEAILRLRAAEERIAPGKRPEQDVIARVNATLADAGLPLSTFGGQAPESDAAIDNRSAAGDSSRYRRQAVRLTLRELTVPQLGGFLTRWRATQPAWVPTRLELTHARSTPDSARFDVSLLITCVYLEAP